MPWTVAHKLTTGNLTASYSYLEGKAFRHGDIEDSELAGCASPYSRLFGIDDVVIAIKFSLKSQREVVELLAYSVQ